MQTEIVSQDAQLLGKGELATFNETVEEYAKKTRTLEATVNLQREMLFDFP